MSNASDRPIFILGVHKSGTSLLRNLLDGHPALHVVPIELHFPYCLGLGSAYPRRWAVGSRDLTWRDVRDRMGEVVKAYQVSGDPRADAYLPGRFDLERFHELLSEEGRPDASSFLAYVGAVHQALGVPPPGPDQRIVEKSVDDLEHAAWLQRQWPSARFVVIVRDPYANLVSLRRFVSQAGRFPSLVQPLRTLELGFTYALRHQQCLDGTLVIRYEDLVGDPPGTMRIVADHLELDWHEGLLEPTVLGVPWRGNSTTGRPLEGVTNDHTDRWRKEITGIEIDLVNRSRLPAFMDLFGYDRCGGGSPWRPAAGERVRTYLRNRAWRLFADGT